MSKQFNDNKIFRWVNERAGIEAFDYDVPPHANTFPFSLGGITVVNILLLIITGVILLQFFSPTPETANQSVRYIMTGVPLGSYIRGIHYWAAQFAMGFLIAHLIRVFLYGSYKRPREANWLLGVALFVIMAGFFFTGYVIKWDQEGFEGLAHAKEITEQTLGPLGAYLGDYFNTNIVAKIESFHVSVLPILLVIAVVFHFFLVKLLKISPLPYSKGGEKTESHVQHTFFGHLKKQTAYAFINTGVVSLLAIFLPPPIGPLPVAGVESARPPWPFMGIFSIENWLGILGLAVASALVIALLIIVPFIDRGSSPLWKDRKFIVTAGIAFIAILIGLTVNAYLSKPGQHIGMSGKESQSMEKTNEKPTQNTGPTDPAQIVQSQLDQINSLRRFPN